MWTLIETDEKMLTKAKTNIRSKNSKLFSVTKLSPSGFHQILYGAVGALIRKTRPCGNYIQYVPGLGYKEKNLFNFVGKFIL